MYLKGIKFATPLNYIDYDKEKAKATIKKELGWKDYGLKHGESIYTRFYQFYILPTRFNVDKRKPHLSTLICSGQMTREEALKELKNPLYTKEQFEADKTFVLEKMGISEQTFFRWKKKYGGLGVSELRRLRQLEEENRQLKRLVADLTLDKQMLQDALSKKF